MAIRRFLAALIFALLPAAALAQQVYTIPTTVGPKTCLNAASSPTASPEITPNVSQTLHWLTYTTSGTINTLSVQIEGSNDGTHWVAISNVASSPSSGAVFANVYYPHVRCNLTAISGGGTITASYTGSTGSAGAPAGIFNTSGIFTQTVAHAANANNSGTTYSVTTPTGNTGGYLYIQFTGVPLADAGGVLLNVLAGPDSQHLVGVAGAQQLFPGLSGIGNPIYVLSVPPVPASAVSVTYASGLTGGTFDLFYSFGEIQVPGQTLGPSNGSLGSAIPNTPIVCNKTVPISISSAGASPGVELIPLISLHQIKICSISFSFNTAVDWQLISYGSASCTGATSLSSQTGTYKNSISAALDFGPSSPFAGQIGGDMCLVTSANVTAGGVIVFSQ